MARFLELYVHGPLQALLKEAPYELPELRLRMSNEKIIVEVGEEYIVIPRTASLKVATAEDGLPEDIDEAGPVA